VADGFAYYYASCSGGCLNGALLTEIEEGAIGVKPGRVAQLRSGEALGLSVVIPKSCPPCKFLRLTQGTSENEVFVPFR
jgi:hypothetical protein